MAAVARFRINVRCSGCHKMTGHRLDVPDVEDAPREVDELLASAFLQRQKFMCGHCDSWIGHIVAVGQEEIEPA